MTFLAACCLRLEELKDTVKNRRLLQWLGEEVLISWLVMCFTLTC